MISVTCSRPFSELGDQQLLDQTRRLAANQRCLDVHILDHLDEIDRRGLALRRGFSSLFDYAVRELRFTDAAAQRRIQAMRLCRRHGWVRASLQSGELSMTAAGQLETTFAGAERAERQCRTGRRNVGGTRQLGLPAAPGEAGEQRERGHQSAPELAPPAEQCSDDAAAVNTPVVPVVSHAGAQAPGAGHAGHAGALLPRPELNGHDSPSPAPSCDRDPVAAPVAGAVAGPAAPSSDEGPTPQPLPPTDLPAQASASAPVPAPVLPVAAVRRGVLHRRLLHRPGALLLHRRRPLPGHGARRLPPSVRKLALRHGGTRLGQRDGGPRLHRAGGGVRRPPQSGGGADAGWRAAAVLPLPAAVGAAQPASAAGAGARSQRRRPARRPGGGWWTGAWGGWPRPCSAAGSPTTRC